MAGLYGLAAVSAAASASPAAMARSDLAAVYTPAHGKFPADIVDFSASQLSLAIRLRTVSCEEVMRAYLKHIHRYNPVYNALVALVDDDTLVAESKVADTELARGEYRGWMHGFPHAVKDLQAVAGLPLTRGSPIYRDNVADADSALTARLRGAGAIFVGKTNTPEFGLGSQTYNPVYGATGSGWNPELTAGGSSGGAASGLATHMLPVADGSDMMGSLRNPAAFNNVIGFRPSAGLLGSSDPMTRPLSTSGPMGRNVQDTMRLMHTLMPSLPADAPQALHQATPHMESFSSTRLSATRIGWLADFDGYLAMEPGVLDLCQASLAHLAKLGVRVEAVQPRFDMAELWHCWLTLRNLSRVRLRGFFADPATHDLLKPELRWEIERSFELTAADVYRANDTRARWYGEVGRLFERFDFLVLPTAQVFPFPKTLHWPQRIADRTMDTYHRWMEVVIPGSLAGLPVVNVPVGFDADARPMGMQIMGPFGADGDVFAFAAAYEAVTSFLSRRPVLTDSSGVATR